MIGSLGMPEILFILVLALLVFGPKRLPELGRTLGKGLREFRRATTDLKRTVESEMDAADREPPRPTAAVEAVAARQAQAEAQAEPQPGAETGDDGAVEPRAEAAAQPGAEAEPAVGAVPRDAATTDAE
jgi:sec-independent protein translocase protein TatA